jgi:uncharacterized protein YecE (DUF72 family)
LGEAQKGAAVIKVGIGGWTYEPWRGLFYPEKLPKTKELFHASRQLTSIEVNGTFYSTFKPPTFRKWADETPDDFVFALKAPMFAVNRKVLAEAGPSIEKFVESGIGELQSKLGPILWQLAATKKYNAEDIGRFLTLLPREINGRKQRHALEARHETFRCAEFLAQARAADVAVVLADSEKFPMISEVTSDFVYVRLQESQADVVTGYSADALDHWTKLARGWERGEDPIVFPRIAAESARVNPRDVFVYFISGAKERNPAAAEAMIAQLKA